MVRTDVESREVVLTKVSDKELTYEMFMGGEKPVMSIKFTKK